MFNTKKKIYINDKKTKCIFYYIKKGRDVPIKLNTTAEWIEAFKFKVITRSTCDGFTTDHPIDKLNGSPNNFPTNPSQIRNFTTHKRKLQVLYDIGGFWDSPEMK